MAAPPAPRPAPPRPARPLTFLLLQRDWLATRANQNTETRRGAGAPAQHVGERSSNPISSKCVALTDFNYISF